MVNQTVIYVNPEHNLSEICEHLECVTDRYVLLVIPAMNQLRSFGTWRMLHAYARRRSLTIQIVSDSAYIRSIARSARFKVADTLDPPIEERAAGFRHVAQFPPPLPSVEQADVEEGVNFFFPLDDKDTIHSVQQFSHAKQDDEQFTFILEDDEDIPSSLHLLVLEPPGLPTKAPKPLTMPVRRTRPLVPSTPPPRLPWDDDDELLPRSTPKMLPRRRTGPLTRSIVPARSQAHGKVRKIRNRREPKRFVLISPIAILGIFVLVRSIVQYLRRR